MDNKEYDIREHTVTEKILVKHDKICDVCRKVMDKGYYFRVITGHYDWGNDSCDSVEDFDICSQECLAGYMLEHYFPNQKEYNTQYINIKPEYWKGTMTI